VAGVVVELVPRRDVLALVACVPRVLRVLLLLAVLRLRAVVVRLVVARLAALVRRAGVVLVSVWAAAGASPDGPLLVVAITLLLPIVSKFSA
jgi:hypothetical protein